MNYFSHAHRFLDDPYFVVGTSLPDWLNVVDRRVRVRGRHAEVHQHDADARVAAIARGVLQHLADDAWFHETQAFHELSLGLAVRCRELLPDDEGFRPSFLGHILVEILLDAALIQQMPERLERYYQVVAEIDPALVESTVNRMAARSTDRLAELIPHFSRERFLSDYVDDGKLCFRLNQVMRRVKLPPLPESFAQLLPQARRQVTARMDELLLSPGG